MDFRAITMMNGLRRHKVILWTSVLVCLTWLNVAAANTQVISTPPQNDIMNIPRPNDSHDLTKIPDTPQTPSPITSPTNTPTLSSDDLLGDPELLEHALYSSIVLNNVPAVQKLLPLYQTLPNANDDAGRLLVTMSNALLHRAKGETKSAIKLYRQVLVDYPNLNDVRLTLSKLLMDDHQNEAAKDQLLRLRSESNLSNEQRHAITHYLGILDKKSTWSFNGGLGYAYDPNVGNVPDRRTIAMNGGTWTFSEPEQAHGIAYQASASKDWNVKDNLYFRLESQLQGKSYWSNHDHDDLVARMDVGIAHKDSQKEFAILPYHQRRLLGGNSYTQETGLRAEYSHWLMPQHQILTALEWGHEKHDNAPRLSGESISTSATWLYIQNARRYWTLGSDYTYKDAYDKSRAYHRYGLRGSWTQEWRQGITTSLALDIGHQRHQSQDFFGIKRHDTEYVTRASVWHRGVHFWGITPRLTMTYRKTDGNHPVYEYSKANAFIQFNKTF